MNNISIEQTYLGGGPLSCVIPPGVFIARSNLSSVTVILSQDKLFAMLAIHCHASCIGTRVEYSASFQAE
jgi:hypothetical protein